MREPDKRALRARLLSWYERHRRDLPWRRTRHPYRIWVAEIMLQQTRVAAVLGHYRRFLRRFPSLRRLSAARPDSMLAAWSGLGYYRRARSLHAAARLLVREHGGRLPRTSEEWRRLPGVGRYTAAAIASIAFGEPQAVVDGNVERVLRRLLGSRRRISVGKTWESANELLSRERPGDFNQAMMELGAIICLPSAPKCPQCPLEKWCRTRGAARRATPVRRRRRAVTYALAATSDAVWLVRRPGHSARMPGMWELPVVEPFCGRERGAAEAGAHGRNPEPAAAGGGSRRFEPRPQSRKSAAALITLRHSILDTDYAVEVVRQSGAPGEESGAGQWIARRRLERLPLTGLARKILRRAAII